MKTSNKFWQLSAVLLLTVGFLAGCKKNDNSSSATTNQVYPNWANCASCAGAIGQPIPGLVGIHSDTASGDALFAFDIIVNNDGRVNWQDPKAILAYAGPATLQGVIRITTSGNSSFCGAPAGDYEVRPMNSSMVSQGGIVSGGTFQAVGPAQIIFRVGNSQIYNAQDPNGVYNGSAYNRIGFSLMIDQVQVNGYGSIPCGPLQTY